MPIKSINIQSPIAPWMLSVGMEFFLKQRVRPVTLFQGKNRPVSFPSLTKNGDFCLAFSGFRGANLWQDKELGGGNSHICYFHPNLGK